MSMENELHNKKNLFSTELFLERSHTHTPTLEQIR